MASAPQQQQTQEERDQIKLGQEQTQRARTKSAPLLADAQKKMNRDDSGRLAGMASADVMQAAGTDRTGQQLSSGQGGGYTPTGLGGQLSQATNSASNAALSRQDSMKSSYNNLGNKKNMNAVAGLKSLAGDASKLEAADAYAAAASSKAMLDAAVTVGGSYALDAHDKYETADYDYKRAIKKAGYSGIHESDAVKSLRDTRNNLSGANIFKRLGEW